jgi:hypothetical protein
MTNDRYTKAVLTVIAVALSAIAIQLTTKQAHAQSGLRFSPSGALMVTICDPLGALGSRASSVTCADVLNEGVTVSVRR